MLLIIHLFGGEWGNGKLGEWGDGLLNGLIVEMAFTFWLMG